MKQQLIARTIHFLEDTTFLQEVCLVTQLSGNVGISVRRIVWVTTDCRLMSHVSCEILRVIWLNVSLNFEAYWSL
jgi:hypothetical protein